MNGLSYQLKNIAKDKMAILSFFLPIVMAVLINLISTGTLNAAMDMRFAVIENNLPKQMEDKLTRYGHVIECHDKNELGKIVMNPADETIGIIYNEHRNEVKTILSGDETSRINVVANEIVSLLDKPSVSFKVTTLPMDNDILQFKSLLIALVMITALFISCTFNTMNIVSEKEDGIVYVNEVLPMSFGKYIMQKIFLGFIGGIFVSTITACICLNITIDNALVTVLLIIVPSFMASLLGMYISKASENLIMAIVYIKMTLIIFIAVPLIAHLFVAENRLKLLFHLLPSYSVFDGLLKIMDGNTSGAIVNTCIIIMHCIVWCKVYFVMNKRSLIKK